MCSVAAVASRALLAGVHTHVNITIRPPELQQMLTGDCETVLCLQTMLGRADEYRVGYRQQTHQT